MSSLAVRTTCLTHYRSDSCCNDSGGSSSHCLSVMATLETCSASSKLVILRSQTSAPFGATSRIPSIILSGLFMNFTAGQLATPKATTTPFSFPMSGTEEPEARASSPKYWGGQRRQTAIDPTLVSSGPLFTVMTLRNLGSRCTSVSLQPRVFTHSNPTFQKTHLPAMSTTSCLLALKK